jgi:ubiquinone/menaquinone biosynthesis C-methylase UbiE
MSKRAFQEGNFLYISQHYFRQAYKNIARDIKDAAYLKGLTEKDRILEIGGGTGWLTLEVSQFTSAQIVFLELNSELIKLAQDNFKKQGISEQVEIKQGDTHNPALFPENSFSFIFSRGVIQFLDLETVLNNIIKWLKPNGMAFIGGGFGKNAEVSYIEKLYRELPEIMASNDADMERMISSAPDFLFPYLKNKIISHYKFSYQNGYWIEIHKR